MPTYLLQIYYEITQPGQLYFMAEHFIKIFSEWSVFNRQVLNLGTVQVRRIFKVVFLKSDIGMRMPQTV